MPLRQLLPLLMVVPVASCHSDRHPGTVLKLITVRSDGAVEVTTTIPSDGARPVTDPEGTYRIVEAIPQPSLGGGFSPYVALGLGRYGGKRWELRRVSHLGPEQIVHGAMPYSFGRSLIGLSQGELRGLRVRVLEPEGGRLYVVCDAETAVDPTGDAELSRLGHLLRIAKTLHVPRGVSANLRMEADAAKLSEGDTSDSE